MMNRGIQLPVGLNEQASAMLQKANTFTDIQSSEESARRAAKLEREKALNKPAPPPRPASRIVVDDNILVPRGSPHADLAGSLGTASRNRSQSVAAPVLPSMNDDLAADQRAPPRPLPASSSPLAMPPKPTRPVTVAISPITESSTPPDATTDAGVSLPDAEPPAPVVLTTTKVTTSASPSPPLASDHSSDEEADSVPNRTSSAGAAVKPAKPAVPTAAKPPVPTAAKPPVPKAAAAAAAAVATTTAVVATTTAVVATTTATPASSKTSRDLDPKKRRHQTSKPLPLPVTPENKERIDAQRAWEEKQAQLLAKQKEKARHTNLVLDD